jgi:tetratricopeptide (TPR) repeat protein
MTRSSALLPVVAVCLLTACGGGLAPVAEADRTTALERVTEDPTDPDINYQYARILIRAGEPQEAISRLEFNLTLNPDHAASRRLLLQQYLAAGSAGRAIPFALGLKERGVALEAADREALLASGAAWLAGLTDFRPTSRVESWERFARWLDQEGSAEQKRQAAAFRVHLARFRMQGGYYREALELVEGQALGDPQAGLLAGEAAFLLGEPELGRRHVDAALEGLANDPAGRQAALAEVAALLEEGLHFEAALGYLKALVQVRGESPEDLRHLGSLCLDAEDLSGATAYLERYVAAGTGPDTVLEVATLLVRARRAAEAEKLLLAGVQAHPESFALVQELLAVTGGKDASRVLGEYLARAGASPDTLARVAGYFRKHQKGKGCADFFAGLGAGAAGNPFALGQCALAEGKVDEAIRIFEQGLKDQATLCRSVDSISDFLGEGAATEKKFEFLEKYYKRGCRGQGVVVRLFNLYIARGRVQDGERVIQAFLEAERFPPEVVVGIAEGLSSRKLFDQGIRYLEAAIKQHGERVPDRAWFLLGTYYGLTERPLELVFNTFNTYVDKSPDHKAALHEVEGVYLQNKRLSPGLIGVYHRLSQVDPADTEVLLSLGRFALSLGAREQAIEHLVGYVERLGWSGAALRTALAEFKEGSPQDALGPFLEKAGRAPDADREAHQLLGQAWVQQKRPDRAYPHFRRMLELAVREGGITEEDGDRMAAMQFSDLALIAYEHVRARKQGSSRLLGKTAQAYLRLDNLDKARGIFPTIREAEPEDADRTIGFLLFKASYFAEAIEPLRAAFGRPMAKGHEHLFDVLAQSLIYSGRAAEVPALCRDYLKRAPDGAVAAESAVPRLLQVRDYRAVVELIGPLADVDPPAEAFQEPVARAWLLLGDGRRAAAYFQRAATARSDGDLEYARLLVDSGFRAEAEPFLERAASDPNNGFRARLLRGEGLLRAGLRDEARRELVAGLEVSDDPEAVLRYLLALYRDLPALPDLEAIVREATPAIAAATMESGAADLVLAQVLFLTGRDQEALEAAEGAVQRTHELAGEVATLFERAGYAARAIPLYQAALDYPYAESFPASVRALLLELNYQGRLDEVRATARRVLENARAKAEAADLLVQVFLDLERVDLALDYARQGLKLDPTEDRQFLLAKVLFVARAEAEAMEAAGNYLDFPVRDGAPDERLRFSRLSQLLSFLMSRGDLVHELAVLDASRRGGDDEVPLFRIRATLYLYAGRSEEALTAATAYFARERRDAENEALFVLFKRYGLLERLEAALRVAWQRQPEQGLGVVLYRTLMARGLVEEARAFSEKLLVDEAVDRPGLFFRLGIHSYFEGRAEDSSRFLASALKARDPDVAAEAGFWLIRNSLLTGQTALTEDTARLLMRRIDPPEKALQELATFFYMLQDFDRARDYVDRALAVKPGRDAYFLALDLELTRRNPQAVRERVLLLQPASQIPGVTLSGVGNWVRKYYTPEGRAAVEDRMERELSGPCRNAVHSAESALLFGDASAGERALREVLETGVAMPCRTYAAEVAGRWGLAVDSQVPQVGVTLLQEAVTRGDQARAAHLADVLLANPGLSDDDLSTLGNAVLRHPGFPTPQALALARRLEAGGDVALARMVEAVALLASGEAARGREVLEAFLGLGYRVAWAKRVAGQGMLERGDAGLAVKLLDEAIREAVSPTDYRTTVIEALSRAMERVPGMDPARKQALGSFGVRLCDEALAWDPLNIWYLTMKAELLFQGGDQAGGAKVYEEAIAVLPMDSSLRNNHAYLLARGRFKLEEALRDVRLAERLDPSQNKYYKDTEGWVLFQMGRAAEARALVEESLYQIKTGAPSDFTEVLYHLGMIQRQLGKERDARQAFQQAAYFDPGGLYGTLARQELAR